MSSGTDSGPTLIRKGFYGFNFYLCIRIPESAKHIFQQQLTVPESTLTTEDVAIWVACYVLATSGVRLMAPRTTLTLVGTALATARVVPVIEQPPTARGATTTAAA